MLNLNNTKYIGKHSVITMYINKLQVINGKYVLPKSVGKKLYCKDCQHYSKNGELCRLFMSTDLTSSVERAVKATDARGNDDMCGKNAVDFQEKKIQYAPNDNDSTV